VALESRQTTPVTLAAEKISKYGVIQTSRFVWIEAGNSSS
jgi:hypothetical protein